MLDFVYCGGLMISSTDAENPESIKIKLKFEDGNANAADWKFIKSLPIFRLTFYENNAILNPKLERDLK